MDTQIVSESSSCDTASYSEPTAARMINLDIYYTPIYKDPALLNSETQVIKKQLFIFHDSYVLAHNHSSKVKVVHQKKQTLKLLKDGFEIIAQVIFEQKKDGTYVFTIQRNISQVNCHPSFKQALKSYNRKSIDSLVFVSVKNQRDLSQSQLIKDNGFIKMGKEIYETRIVPHCPQIADTIKLKTSSDNKIFNLNAKQNPMQCKICLVNQGQSNKDYIVSPCKCSGSCSAVHVECLKQWISQKIQVGNGNSKLRTYDMDRFACEICKQKYPEILQIENSVVEISPRFRINSDTLILTRAYPVEVGKMYSHFISLEKGKAISIGRHYMNELILDEMSISRTHSEIYRSFEDQGFYIHDKNSRFGTFSNLESPIPNLKEITLLTTRLTFRLRIEDKSQKASFSSSGDEEMTEEKIDY